MKPKYVDIPFFSKGKKKEEHCKAGSSKVYAIYQALEKKILIIIIITGTQIFA